MFPNAKSIITHIDAVLESHREFSKYTLDIHKPKPGPYAIFHHHGLFLERIQDVSSTIERMGKARYRITVLNERQERLEPATGIKPGKPYPKYLQKIATESHKLTNLMRLDNEILYIFGNLTLDQWAYTVAYSLGLPSPQNYSYHYFISQLQAKNSDPKLSLFKSRHFKDALWLYYQLRFYRNNFIEHVDRPWQRGSTMSTYGSDFSFFIPTPSGWIPDHVQEQMIGSVKHLAPDWVKRLPSDHWQAKPRAVLEAIFKQIDEIPTQAKRDAVWNVWKEIGGSVVSFDALGNRLVNFLDGSTITLFEELAAHPDYTNFGASPYAQDKN